MDITKLNLARKWRSGSFEGIVGQDLVIKMLKNSLYAGHYFPVYLFCGQRGCGKTTTARVFASALNCEQLHAFQKKPKEIVIPCGLCTSCIAIREGRHQDFIELDAASHTGVDTIRQLIEDAAFLPVIGRKKVYLIDEAHMLSKAAFNALLKILEEPPASAIFILATTDVHKILETVRSRCFSLYFKPIKVHTLTEHLGVVCEAEKIVYTKDGLSYIASHAEGSARDALNILEQVRFASGGITKKNVLAVLGHIDDNQLISLLTIVAQANVKDLLTFWQEANFNAVSIEFIWNRLLILVRMLIWMHYGALKDDNNQELYHLLKPAAATLSLSFLHQLMEALYKAEPLLMRTSAQHGLLEMVLLQLCTKKKYNSGNSGATASPQAITETTNESDDQEEDVDESEDVDDEEPEEEDYDALWRMVCSSLDTLHDPLLTSLFLQGVVHQYDKKMHTLHIHFPERLAFFADRLKETQERWQPLVRAVFDVNTHVEFHFDKQIAEDARIKQPSEKEAVSQQHDSMVTVTPSAKPSRTVFQSSNTVRQHDIREKKIDVSDIHKWQKVNLILKHFPGSVTEVQEAH